MPKFGTQFFIIAAIFSLFFLARICYKRFIDILTKYSTDITDDELAEINLVDTDDEQSIADEESAEVSPPRKKEPVTPEDNKTELFEQGKTETNKSEQHISPDCPFENVKSEVLINSARNSSLEKPSDEANEGNTSYTSESDEHPFEIVKPEVLTGSAHISSLKKPADETTGKTFSYPPESDEHPFKIVRPEVQINTSSNPYEADVSVEPYSDADTEPKTVKRSNKTVFRTVPDKPFSPLKK